MSDWSLPCQVFAWLEPRISWMRVVELGSGEGTSRLAGMCHQLWSVEHDPKFIRAGLGTQFIHAPIRDGWYDVDVLRELLPFKFDALVVDGPPGSIGRGGLLEHLDLFSWVPMLIDDVHRQPELNLAMTIAALRGEMLSLHRCPNGRAFATLGWEIP